MNSTFNYYELLGVKENASKEEIKVAYKKQMKKWHPDINKSDDAISMSAKINEAKEVLLDDTKRKDYDEYLKKKIDENYSRYTQRKAYSENNKKEASEYEDKKVTKWQYFNDFLKHANISFYKKVLSFIGVMLETLLCFIIKCLLIIIAYIAFYISYFIRLLYSFLSPIFGILGLLLVGMCLTTGIKETINDNPGILTAIIVLISIYIISFILPSLSRIILSPKTFDILYNKIDITLFKKCVGYKD